MRGCGLTEMLRGRGLIEMLRGRGLIEMLRGRGLTVINVRDAANALVFVIYNSSINVWQSTL